MTLDRPFRAIPEQPTAPLNTQRRSRFMVRAKAKTFCVRLAEVCLKSSVSAGTNTLFFGGLAAIVIGCYQIYPPLGPIVGGGLSAYLGFVLSEDKA